MSSGECRTSGLIPTTVVFSTTPVSTLILNGAAPSDAVTNTTDGEGIVTVQATVTSAAAFGVATTGDLLSLTVNDAATFNLGHNLAATTVTVGTGATGIVNQSAGTITATTLVIAAGGTLTQSGSGVINATNTTIATGGTLTVVNQGTGAIDGAAGGQGALVFVGDYDTDAALGATSLASITVNDTFTLTLDQSAGATTFTVGTGTSGIVNQSAGTITATTLVIAAGGTLTQSGGGVINATNTTIATGGTLTVVNQGTGAIDGAAGGQGALVFAGDYDTDAALGTTSLASITVNDTFTLTLDQSAGATTFTVGEGTSGIVNQSAGTITATTLVIAAGGTLTQSGSGVINATNTTIATGGTLTVVNQGTGAIDGAAGGQGALVFAGDYDTDAALGATSLASITVNDTFTLTLDQSAGATTFTVGEGTSGIVNQSAGTITATTLVIAAGGTLTQSGSGVINATNTTIATGGTRTVVNQGTGAIDGAAGGQGALVFAGDYDTDAVLGATSLASITVNNGTTLTLDQDADATAFNANGAVTHSLGTLTATNLTIASGGTFTQSGGAITATTGINAGGAMTVTSAFTHTGALNNSGTLNLGGNTVTVTTTVTLAGGATLTTTINSDTADDAGRVVATGIATTAANTTINITVTPATLTAGQTYVIVSGGAGGSVVVPTTIIDDSANHNFVASTDGNSLTLTVQLAAAFTGTATTPNTSAVATALEAAALEGDADMATVIAALNSLGSDAARDAAMATMTPDAEGGLIVGSLGAQSLTFGTVGSRIEAVRTGALTSERGLAAGDPATGIGIWLQAAYNAADQDPRQGASGFNVQTAGFAFGGDKILSDSPWTVGAAYGFAFTDLDSEDVRSGNGTDIQSHQGVVYGSYDGDRYFIDALANIAFNSYETTRQIAIGPAFTRRATGDFYGMQYSAKATTGIPLALGGFVVTPMASVQYTHLDVDSYTETGAGPLNLNVADQDYDLVQTGLGLKASFDVVTKSGTLSPGVRAMWLYDAVTADQTITSTFAGGGTSFDTRSPDAARHGAIVGVSLTYRMSDYLSLGAAYDAELRDRYLGHSGLSTPSDPSGPPHWSRTMSATFGGMLLPSCG